ncbi:MAG: hypothetical protein PHH08_04870 [Candidatus ainarchaeum sp.]|nr:hypothetical protein [Candidatus ainarchaeum sp.]
MKKTIIATAAALLAVAIVLIAVLYPGILFHETTGEINGRVSSKPENQNLNVKELVNAISETENALVAVQKTG